MNECFPKEGRGVLPPLSWLNRLYSHKLLTINNYVNCPSNFVFARSIYLFHLPIFEKILMRIRSITSDVAICNASNRAYSHKGKKY